MLKINYNKLMENNKYITNTYTSPLSWIIAVFTGLVGYHVNCIQGSNWPLFWAVMDFLFWGFAWIKWLIMGQVSLTIIRETLAAFLS